MAVALADNALIDLDVLKSFLNLEADDTTQDIKLTFIINGVSELIETITGRKLKAADYVHKYEGTDEQELIMEQYPINTVTEVIFLENAASFYIYRELEYEILPEEGILFNPFSWYKTGYSNYLSNEVDYPTRYIQVTYNAGYTVIPADLQMIALEAAMDIHNRNESDARNLSSFKISDTAWNWGSNTTNIFTSGQLSTIRRYKKVHI